MRLLDIRAVHGISLVGCRFFRLAAVRSLWGLTVYGWRLDKQSPGMQQRNRAKLEPQLGPDSAAYTSNCYAAPQKDNYRLLKL
jgi:hypothetical protein